ncbi:amidase [candidate division KSB1 bacterium]|nr:amidase [candidate division KSB1 bacterium]
MKRRDFLKASLAGQALLLGSRCIRSGEKASSPDPDNDPWSLAQMRQTLEQGDMTSEAWTQKLLTRIQEIDAAGPALNSIIELNPEALDIARERDQERRTGQIRGPLHGVPVVIKDNIDTADSMSTSAGSLALAAHHAQEDAFVVQKLRQAGAVLLAKTNLSEWANFRSTRSTSGWSGRGGQTRNPHVLDRNPCGSSSGSGVAVAAGLAPLALGTETDGSVVCPSTINGIVGIKPTLGLVSRSGIIPIAHSQDTAGPMARTVTDAALLLATVMGQDARDPATRAIPADMPTDFMPFLQPTSLEGARLGIARNLLDFHPEVDRLFDEAVNDLEQAGATVIDDANIETIGDIGDPEFEVLLYEFKSDLNAYLTRARETTPGIPADLEALIRFNEEQSDQEMPYFGQELFHMAQEKGPLTDPAYLKALKESKRLAGPEGIDATLQKHNLDAIIAATGSPAWPTDLINGDHFTGGCSTAAAVAGYPHVTVPMGAIHHLPVGLSFFSTAWTDARLIGYAYAFEQLTRHLKTPAFRQTAI